MYHLHHVLAREIDRDRMRAAATRQLARDLRAPARAPGLLARIRHHIVESARSLATQAYSSRGEASDCI